MHATCYFRTCTDSNSFSHITTGHDSQRIELAFKTLAYRKGEMQFNANSEDVQIVIKFLYRREEFVGLLVSSKGYI